MNSMQEKMCEQSLTLTKAGNVFSGIAGHYYHGDDVRKWFPSDGVHTFK